MLGCRYLTARINGMIVRILDITNGFVMARENSIPSLLWRIIRVEVKTAGNAEAIPPRMGPPIWLISTARKTREPAPIPRPKISAGV